MDAEKKFFEKLSYMIERPGMFGIQKVEDIKLIFTGEIVINQNLVIETWNAEFNEYVFNKVDSSLINFDWSKIIRLYSGSDAHSIELFKDLFLGFQSLRK